MSSLKESAKVYEPKKTKVVSDLDSVNIDQEIYIRDGEDNDGNAFNYSYITVDGEDYRIPVSVIEQLQEQINNIPDLKKIKVIKKGEGMKTKYTVIPLPN